MRIEEILRTGDRVEFKRHLAAGTDQEVYSAWLTTTSKPIQDFKDLAFDEMTRRGMIKRREW